jgi:hypothetical protein
MLTIAQRLENEDEMQRLAIEDYLKNLRVACPGIIQSYNESAQTVTVLPAIKEKIKINGNVSDEALPLLVDVPVYFPSGGGYSLTFPIVAGDECLVVFADSCIDAWWQSGGVQSQLDKRRHDLSDAFAFVGFKSKPNAVPAGAGTTLQGGSGSINFNGGTITITNANVNINSSNVTIAGKDFLSHTHSGVQTGGGTTGGVA